MFPASQAGAELSRVAARRAALVAAAVDRSFDVEGMPMADDVKRAVDPLEYGGVAAP